MDSVHPQYVCSTLLLAGSPLNKERVQFSHGCDKDPGLEHRWQWLFGSQFIQTYGKMRRSDANSEAHRFGGQSKLHLSKFFPLWREAHDPSATAQPSRRTQTLTCGPKTMGSMWLAFARMVSLPEVLDFLRVLEDLFIVATKKESLDFIRRTHSGSA